VKCAYFDAGICGSCVLMGTSYDEQLANKQRNCETLLAGHPGIKWLPPVASVEEGFRTKAKMVVGGTVERPTLGILDGAGHGVDLSQCGVIAPGILATFPALVAFTARAGLTPYDVPTRRGELKNLIVTEAPDGGLMVRFVLRSEESVARIRKHLPSLLEALPRTAVVSANIHPEHKATLEGEREIHLTERETLTMRIGDVDLHLRTRSFVQTNTAIASALYRQAREWIEAANPGSVWDLYCGVGGFALHAAAPGRAVTGIEASADAIESARTTAAGLGLGDIRFEATDATAFALAQRAAPDLVVVNPPRRGIGRELAGWLENSGVSTVLYSSCNAVTLAKDLAAMPSLRPVRGRVLDMFPQTTHYEAIVLLERAA
jgi:23S rRNA (uracil747-C5)-methyltransferase